MLFPVRLSRHNNNSRGKTATFIVKLLTQHIDDRPKTIFNIFNPEGFIRQYPSEISNNLWIPTYNLTEFMLPWHGELHFAHRFSCNFHSNISLIKYWTNSLQFVIFLGPISTEREFFWWVNFLTGYFRFG